MVVSEGNVVCFMFLRLITIIDVHISDKGGSLEPWRFTPIHALWIAGGFIGVGFFVWGVMSLRKWVSKRTRFDGRNYHDPEFLGQIAVML